VDGYYFPLASQPPRPTSSCSLFYSPFFGSSESLQPFICLIGFWVCGSQTGLWGCAWRRTGSSQLRGKGGGTAGSKTNRGTSYFFRGSLSVALAASCLAPRALAAGLLWLGRPGMALRSTRSTQTQSDVTAAVTEPPNQVTR
jgi:hypothetical protein